MAFLFKKNKGFSTTDGAQQQQAASSGNRGTPVRKKSSKWMTATTPPTKAIPLTRTPDSIMKAKQGGYDDFEVLTPETRSAIQERNDIRKQLFSDSLDEDDFPSSPPRVTGVVASDDHPAAAAAAAVVQPSRLARTATAQSMEVTSDGRMLIAAEDDDDDDDDAADDGHVVIDNLDHNSVSRSSNDDNNNKSTISQSSASPRRLGYPLLGSFRQKKKKKQQQQQQQPKKQADDSPSHGSINSAIYRGPVSVDSPARVLTKTGQPFDESIETANDEEQERAPTNSAVENNDDTNKSNNSSMLTAITAPSNEQDDSNQANNTTLSSSSSGILQQQQQQQQHEERSSIVPVDLNETANTGSTAETRTTIANDTTTAGSSAQDTVSHVAQQLLGSFQCGGSPRGVATAPTMQSMKGKLDDFKKSRSVQKVMGIFYDRSSSRPQDEKTKEEHLPKKNHLKRRPDYDETFTIRFIRRMTTKGAALLHLQPPGSPGNDSLDWKGRTVTMLLERGMTLSSSSSSTSSSSGSGGATKNNNNNNKLQLLPRLEWTTIAGGQSFDVSTHSIGLFDILSISTSLKNLEDGESKQNDADDNDEHNADDSEQEDDDLCFFSITATNGDLHVFEANSTEERDSIVNGLKNVISRMAFHLVVGDTTASSELFDFDGNMQKFKAGVEPSSSPGDLPSLANPRQTMNRLAHLMLESR